MASIDQTAGCSQRHRAGRGTSPRSVQSTFDFISRVSFVPTSTSATLCFPPAHVSHLLAPPPTRTSSPQRERRPRLPHSSLPLPPRLPPCLQPAAPPQSKAEPRAHSMAGALLLVYTVSTILSALSTQQLSHLDRYSPVATLVFPLVHFGTLAVVAAVATWAKPSQGLERGGRKKAFAAGAASALGLLLRLWEMRHGDQRVCEALEVRHDSAPFDVKLTFSSPAGLSPPDAPPPRTHRPRAPFFITPSLAKHNLRRRFCRQHPPRWVLRHWNAGTRSRVDARTAAAPGRRYGVAFAA